jgi:hypothetical protein
LPNDDEWSRRGPRHTNRTSLARRGKDVNYAVERHELLLLDRNQWQDFFQEAGLTSEYLPDAFSSRGLYVVRSSN